MDFKGEYQAVILAGGLGTRLKPITETIPKPLVEINGKPFLEHLITYLNKFGIKKFVLCVGYLGNKIEEYFGNGEKWGIEIKYSYEKELLGTAGAIKNAEKLISSENFLVLNGDSYSQVDFNSLTEEHLASSPPITMVVSPASNPLEQELIKLEGGKVVEFYRRNTNTHNEFLKKELIPKISAGIYIFNKSVLNLIPLGEKVSLEKEIFPSLKGKIKGFEYNGYFKDLANINFCREFEEDLKKIEELSYGKEKLIKDLISKNFSEHISIIQQAETIFTDKIAKISEVIINVYKNDKKVLIAGNGGSAADAQHIAGELMNKFYYDRRALSAIALSTDTSVLTSWANDKSFDFVFERQIEAHGNKGDIFIAISTSGNSVNLINAVKKAKEKEMIVIGLLGRDGGKLKELCDYDLTVLCSDTPRIQEVHELVYHTMCQLVEQSLII